MYSFLPSNVRSGLKADIHQTADCRLHVRFTRKANIALIVEDVRFVP